MVGDIVIRLYLIGLWEPEDGATGRVAQDGTSFREVFPEEYSVAVLSEGINHHGVRLVEWTIAVMAPHAVEAHILEGYRDTCVEKVGVPRHYFGKYIAAENEEDSLLRLEAVEQRSKGVVTTGNFKSVRAMLAKRSGVEPAEPEPVVNIVDLSGAAFTDGQWDKFREELGDKYTFAKRVCTPREGTLLDKVGAVASRILGSPGVYRPLYVDSIWDFVRCSGWRRG
jgi:hypothetical protein